MAELWLLGDSGEQGQSECPLARGDVRGDLRAPDGRSASALTGRAAGRTRATGGQPVGRPCPGA